MNAKRGYVPEDERNFAPEALAGLRTASRQVLFLINEGYDLKQATTFVGNHYLLSERQRLAIITKIGKHRSVIRASFQSTGKLRQCDDRAVHLPGKRL